MGGGPEPVSPPGPGTVTNGRRGAALLFGALLAGCSSKKGPGTGPAEKQSAPDQVISQFSVDNVVDGERRWVLESPKAYVYETEKHVDIDYPKIRFMDKGKPGTLMQAGRGRYFTETGSLRSWDGVVLVSTDGALVESPWMDYDARRDLVTSTAPLTVTRQDSILRGVGWEAKSDVSRVIVHHQTIEYVEPAK
jgi:LPS export ABC transporter protein LptC